MKQKILLLLILYLILHPEIVIIYIIILSKFINYFNGFHKHSVHFHFYTSDHWVKLYFSNLLSFIYQDSNHMGQQGDQSSNFPIVRIYILSV